MNFEPLTSQITRIFSNNKNRNLEELHYFILTFFLGSYNGKRYSLPKYSFDHARRVFDDNPLDDVLFTFGVEKSGQLVLHNYPTTLMNLRIPKHQKGGRVIQHIVFFTEIVQINPQKGFLFH